jgi:hypothetical protein
MICVQRVQAVSVFLICLGGRTCGYKRVRFVHSDLYSQAVGLESGQHGRRPTDGFAQRVSGVADDARIPPSPDSSGSPQRCDAAAAS